MKVLHLSAIFLGSLLVTSTTWAPTQSGELILHREMIFAMLQEVKPEVKAGRRDIRQMIKELESQPQRDLYEEVLLQELKRWLHDKSFGIRS